MQEKVGDLDLDSAKAFGSKNLDVLKDNQERALIDAAAAGGLLFSAYGAVVFALGWFAAAPSTAYSRPADSYGACIETALPAGGGPAGMLLTFTSVGLTAFAVLIPRRHLGRAALYLDTNTPSASDLPSADVGRSSGSASEAPPYLDKLTLSGASRASARCTASPRSSGRSAGCP